MNEYDKLPECCKDCLVLNFDPDELSGITYWYCQKNIWWPTKNETCKKQRPYRAELNERGGE